MCSETMIRNAEGTTGVASTAPFFIVGCERSGSTLLQTLLDAHPNIAIPPESTIFYRFTKLFPHYGDLRHDRNLHLFVKDLLGHNKIKQWGLNVSVSDFCDRLETRSISGCIKQLFEFFVKKEGKKRWGEKTPAHVMFLNEIKALFPDAKFIHLIRDGRDVAVSLRTMWFGPTSVYSLAHVWRTRVVAFRNFKSRVPSDTVLEVLYEELVRDPQGQLCRILDFLGEHYIDVSGGVPETSRKRQYLRLGQHHRMLTELISDKKVGIYRSVYGSRAIEVFEAVAGDTLRAYGYEMETSGNTTIGRWEKLTYMAQDLYFRFYRKLGQPSFVANELKFRLQVLARSMRAPEV